MFTKTLLPDTLRAIQLTSKIQVLTKSYLAGGTALALQIGHRESLDLDFFSEKPFISESLEIELKELDFFKSEGTAKGTVWGSIGKTKFSLFYYPYPLIGKTTIFEGIALASKDDIAAMKIHALASRGTRRDFIDIYFLSKYFTIAQMLELYDQKYHTLEDQRYSIVRALTYFEDAEAEKEMPKMLIDVQWAEVKNFFVKESKKLPL